ncbi:hypothetical protein [Moorena bouillonii]|nr:hypothetical protein [Moorena bouillonii]
MREIQFYDSLLPTPYSIKFQSRGISLSITTTKYNLFYLKHS